MSKQSAISAIKKVHSTATTQIESELDNPLSASEALEYMPEDGGVVEPLNSSDAFEIEHISLGDIPRTSYSSSYGVDGSTTRNPITTVNGLKISSAVAASGVSGEGTRPGYTIHTTAHHWESELDTMRIQQEARTNNVNAKVHQISNRTSGPVESWLVDIARIGAEGEQLQSTVEVATAPIFLDGPLFPNQLLFWMFNDPKRYETPFDTSRYHMESIIQSYVQSYEELYDRGIPVIGVVKNPQTDICVKSLEDKLENSYPLSENLSESVQKESSVPSIYWNDDSLLFTDALQRTGAEKSEKISVSPWILQTSHDYSADENLETAFDAYDGFDSLTGSGWTASDYRRVFTYVRPPRVNTTPFRVETLYKFASDKSMRKKVIQEALSQMAFQETGIPEAITIADENANISRDARSKIRNATDGAHQSFNDKRGYD